MTLIPGESNMKTTIRAAAAVVTLSAASAAQAQQAVQWRVQDGGNGHWYALKQRTGPISYSALAGSVATDLGGYLATVPTLAEDNFVWQALSSPAFAVLGGYQDVSSPSYSEPGGGWRWVTGDPITSFRWTWNEPSNGLGNGEGVLAYNYDQTWNDWETSNIPLNHVFSYIVEWSADCNGDGIVDYGQCRDGSLPDYNGNNVPDCCESGTACVVGNYPVEWRASEGGNGHWYQLVIEGHPSWTQAKLMAELRGGYLATLTSQAESDLAGVLSRGMPAMLLGGFQDRTSPDYSEPLGAWKWITGEPWSFSNWGKGEPNDASNGHGDPGEDYLYSWTGAQGFKWSDGDNICPECNPGPLLIEWSADCNDDGMVDYGQILQGQLVDADANGVPDVCEVDPCPGDITNGGTVDAADLSILLAAWGTNGQAEFDTDIDGSGLVDGGDLALVLGGWGPCPQ